MSLYSYGDEVLDTLSFISLRSSLLCAGALLVIRRRLLAKAITPLQAPLANFIAF